MAMPDLLTTAAPAVFDDFIHNDTAATNGRFLVTKGTGGTLVGDDARSGGWLKIPTAATNNDYVLLSTQKASFALAAASGAQPGTSLNFQARFTLTEAAATVANFVFGFAGAVAGTIIGDDGAGVPASFNGALLYKVDGGTDILAASSNATAQIKDQVIAPFTSGSTYTVAVSIDVADSETALAKFWVHDETANKIYHPELLGQGVGIQRVAVAGLGKLFPVFGVKAGTAAAQSLLVDYFYAAQNARG